MAEVDPIALAVETSGIEKGIRALNSLAELGPKVEKSMDGVAKSAADVDKSMSDVGSGAAKSLNSVAGSAKSASDSLGKIGGSSAKPLADIGRNASVASSGIGSLSESTRRFVITQENSKAAYASLNEAERKYIDALAQETRMLGMGKAERDAYIAQTRGMSSAAQAFARQIGEKNEALRSQQDALKSSASAAKNTSESYFALAKAGVAAFAGSQVVRGAVDASAAMFKASAAAENLRTSLQFSTGNSAGEIEYLRKVTDELGLKFDSTAAAYGRFAAAARGTAMEGQKTKEVFESIAQASAVMGLSAEQSEGALRALEQMVSKGTVQSEELRGQLGERLPGAFQIAARAMGVTTQELGKMLEKGEVITSDFLPKFAAEIKRSLGDASLEAAGRLDAAVNKFDNAWERLKQRAGDAGISKAIAGELQAVSRDMSAIGETIENAAKSGDGAFMALSKGAGVAAGRTAFATINLAANTLNGTINLLTGNILGLNTKLAILPESFKTNADQIAAMGSRLRDTDKLLSDLQQRSDKAGGGAYYTAEIARVTALRNGYREALSEKIKLTGISQVGGGRGTINPQTVGEIEKEKQAVQDAIKAYVEKDSRLTKSQQKAREVAKAEEENAKLMAKAAGDVNSQTRLRIALQTELGNINEKYKEKASGGSGTAGQSELASIQARVKETQRYIESLKTVGLQAEKTNEGERIAAKLQEELAMGLSKTARASKEKQLAAANELASVLKLKDATESQLKAQKDFEDARLKSATSEEDNIRKIEDRAQAIHDEIEAYGLGAEVLTQLSIARMEERKAILSQFEGSDEQIDRLNREIEAMMKLGVAQDALAGRKLVSQADTLLNNAREMNAAYQDEARLVGLSSAQRAKVISQRQIELKYAKEIAKIDAGAGDEDSKAIARAKTMLAQQEEISAAANKIIQDDFAKTSQQVEQSLTDALMRGFENGKSFAENLRDTLKNMINTLVLRPIVSAIVQPIAGGVASLVGGAASAGGIGGVGAGGGGLWNLLSTGSNLYSSLMSPMFQNFGAAMAGNIQQIGGTLFTKGFESIGSGIVDFGNTIAQFSDAINVAGDIFGYGSALYSLSKGNYGSAVGSAIGTFAGGPLGAAIGSTLGGLIDGFFGGSTPHSGAASEYRAGQSYGDKNTAGNLINARSSYLSEMQGPLDAITRSIGSTFDAIAAKYGGQTGYYVGAGFKSDSKDPSTSFFQIQNPQGRDVDRWTINSREYSSDAEEGYDQYIRDVAMASFKGLGEIIPTWAEDMASKVSASLSGASGADAIAAFQQVVAQIYAVESVFDSLGDTMKAFSGISDSTKGALLGAFGSIEAVSSAAGSFYESFYTDAEKLENLKKQLDNAFADSGYAVPTTLAQYRALVEQQMAAGASGAEFAAVLLGMNGVFKNVSDAWKSELDGMEGFVSDFFSGLKDSIDRLVSDVANTRKDILRGNEPLTEEQIRIGITNATIYAPSKSGIESAESNTGSASQIYNQAKAEYDARMSQASSQQSILAGAAGNLDAQQMVKTDLENQVQGLADWINSLWDGGANSGYRYNKRKDWSDAAAADIEKLNAVIAGMSPVINSLTQDVETQQAIYNALAGSASTAAEALAKAQADLDAAKIEEEKANASYAGELAKFVKDASGSVDKLGELRGEIVKFYESQAAAVKDMLRSAGNIKTVADTVRLGQLNTAQTASELGARYSSAYSMALSTTGSDRVGYVDKMAESLPALSEALRAEATSGSEWRIEVARLIAQANAAASLLEKDAEGNDYEQVTIDLLDEIDAALKELGSVTTSANDMLISAINSASNSELAGLRAIIAALKGEPIPEFANGGMHSGGLRVVGERGWELEATGASRVWNQQQIAAALGGGSNQKLEDIMSQLVEDNRAQASAIVRLQQEQNRMLIRWDTQGLPEERVQ